MNYLAKSIFIGIYPVLAVIGVIYSLLNFSRIGFSWASLGLLLCAIPILIFLGLLFFTQIARTDKNLQIYSVLEVVGLGISVFSSIANGINPFFLFAAILLAIGWWAYVQWYSVFVDRADNRLLEKNAFLPDFPLETPEGDEITSQSFIGHKNIIMFFRGNWCPLCMAQIKELVDMYQELEQRGIQTVLISPQPPGHTRSLARKFKLNFLFAVDRDHRAAKKLGIFAKNGLPTGLQALGYDSDTVLPTIILTDEKGRILHSDLTDNYRIRPEPAAFLDVFDMQ